MYRGRHVEYDFSLARWTGKSSGFGNLFEFKSGSHDFMLKDGIRKRHGYTSVGTITGETTSYIIGMADFYDNNQLGHIVYACSSGSIYDGINTQIVTGLTSGMLKVCFESFLGKLYFANGHDTPLVWTGSGSMSPLTQVPSDWSGNNPTWLINHGKGNSHRMWAFGCPQTPYNVYVSQNGNADNFSDNDVFLLTIDTKDNYGLVGGCVYNDSLFLFGRRKCYIIDDVSVDTSNWGYVEAPFLAGALHHNVIVPTPIDVFIMSPDGHIYSLRSVMKMGDYKLASLTTSDDIKIMLDVHEWIKQNVDFTYSDRFHGIYDPVSRCVMFFVVSNGNTVPDKAIVFDVDKTKFNGWEVWNLSHDVTSSTLVKEFDTFNVYLGRYGGAISKFDNTQDVVSDEGTQITTVVETHESFIDSPRTKKRFDMLTIVGEFPSNITLNVSVYVDGSLKSFVDNVNDGDGTRKYRIRKVGSRIKVVISCSSNAVDWHIKSIGLDFMPLGVEADL